MQVVLGVALLGWSIVQSLATLAVWLYAWNANKSQARASELELLKTEHDQRLRNVEQGITSLQASLQHLPTSDDFSRLSASLAAINAKVESIDARTGRMEDFLSTRRAST